MSLDKAIEYGKEHRKQYRGSKLIDPGCRNHGSCQWCANCRIHKKMKQMPVDDDGKILKKVVDRF